MAKQNKFVSFVMWLIAVLASLAVGGLFTSGTTSNFPVLKYVPASAHPIVGWVIIIVTIIGALLAIWSIVKKKF